MSDNRRQFPRLRAPIFFRSKRFFSSRSSVIDIGLGGLRVFSDDAFKVGDVFEIELLLPSQETLECTARVAWLNELPPGEPAKYDVGLQITKVKDDKLHLLAVALSTAES